MPQSRTRGLIIVGPYYNGKTVIAERFLFHHLKAGGRQRVWIVQTREGAGMTPFVSGIIKDMRAPSPPKSNKLQLLEQVDVLFRHLQPRIIFFDEFQNALRGRKSDIQAIFAFMRRLGALYDISPVLIGDISVYDHINATREMSSRFKTVPVPRWRYDNNYLSLLDTLEAGIPLAKASELAGEKISKQIFEMAEGLIGETIEIITAAAIVAIDSRSERIDRGTLDALNYIPLSKRPFSTFREELL